MPIDSIVFDLDGTLWDTCHACAIAWNTVLARRGIPYREIVADDVRLVTGRPHAQCIRDTFTDLHPDQVEILVEDTATEDNETIARLGGILFEGVEEGLRRLSESYPLFIVSNCQAGYIETFLSLSGLQDLFVDIECIGNTGHPKPENLRRVIERNNLQHPVMVGDTTGDEEAARACGVPFLYVSYGFGHAEAPDHQFDSFPALVAFATK